MENSLQLNNGLTLGSFININSEIIPVDDNGNFDPTRNFLYMHEYGHYLQSQSYGLGYIRTVAIPSLISAMTVKELPAPNDHLDTHDVRWFEIGANKLAKDYFNVGWWNNYDYPLEKP